MKKKATKNIGKKNRFDSPLLLLLISAICISGCQVFGEFQIQYQGQRTSSNSVFEKICLKNGLQIRTDKSAIQNTRLLFASGYDSTNQYTGIFFVERDLDTIQVINGFYRMYGKNKMTEKFEEMKIELLDSLKMKFGNRNAVLKYSQDTGYIPLVYVEKKVE